MFLVQANAEGLSDSNRSSGLYMKWPELFMMRVLVSMLWWPQGHKWSELGKNFIHLWVRDSEWPLTL